MHREIGESEVSFSVTGTGIGSGVDKTWDQDGLLPSEGISLTTDELIRSAFVTGKGSKYALAWDRTRRETMTKNVIQRIETLRQAGVEDFVLSGDYAEDVVNPVILLGYFICDRQAYLSQQIQTRLNEIDPDNHWNWSCTSTFGRHPMYARDLLELWPVLQMPGEEPMFLKHRELFHSNRELQIPKGVITIRRY